MGRLRLSDKVATSQPPFNNVQPSFAEPQQNQTTTVNNGSWSGSQPMSFEYQWQLDGVDIVGETSNSILYLLSMVGKVLTCIVKAVNAFGSSTATAIEDAVSFSWFDLNTSMVNCGEAMPCNDEAILC